MIEVLIFSSLFLNIASDVIDKRTIVNGNPISTSTWSIVGQFILIIPLIGFVSTIDVLSLFLAFLVGSISAASRIIWFNKLSEENKISELVPYLQFSHIFVLALAVLFLGEPTTIRHFLGGILIVLSAFSVSLTSNNMQVISALKNVARLSVILFIAFSTALISIYYKILLAEGISLLTIFFYLKVFQCSILLVVGIGTKSLFQIDQTSYVSRSFILSRLFQTLAVLIYIYALSQYDLVDVQPYAAMSPFLILLMEYLSKKRKSKGPFRFYSLPRILPYALLSIGMFLFMEG